MKGEARTMETTMTREPIWKLWVDTQRRVVSFHEEAGSQLMEFRDREMFLRVSTDTRPSSTDISDMKLIKRYDLPLSVEGHTLFCVKEQDDLYEKTTNKSKKRGTDSVCLGLLLKGTDSMIKVSLLNRR